MRVVLPEITRPKMRILGTASAQRISLLFSARNLISLVGVFCSKSVINSPICSGIRLEAIQFPIMQDFSLTFKYCGYIFRNQSSKVKKNNPNISKSSSKKKKNQKLKININNFLYFL